jgi:AcrR family transcriptional regulator
VTLERIGRDTAPVARKRPKDRTDRILAAAAQLFRERGYHAIGIDEIGEAVGITGPAVYRHFDSKEALLLTAAERAADRVSKALRDAVAEVESPDDELAALVRAGVSATIDDRDLAAVYVRESRHLESPSAMREIQHANAEMHVKALLRRRPELTRRQAGFILQAIVGLASSVLYSPYSPSQVARARVKDVLTRMGVAALLAAPAPEVREPSPPVVDADGSGPTPPVGAHGPHRDGMGPRVRRASRREVILSAAIRLVHERGYQGVGMDDIGVAAGITGPGIYRHFSSKEEILAAAFNRANEQLAASVSSCLAAAATAREAIERLVAAYVDITLSNADLIAVYLTESYALSPERQAAIRRDQRAYTDEWVALLLEDRPGLSEAEARTMVGGAIGLVNGYAWGDLPLPVGAARPVLVTMTTAALLDA